MNYMRSTARYLGLAYSVFAIYFWLFYDAPWFLPAAIVLSVLLVVAIAVAWKWPGRSPELLGGVFFILLGLALLVPFAISLGEITFYSMPIIAALCFPPLVIGVLFVLAYEKNSDG